MDKNTEVMPNNSYFLKGIFSTIININISIHTHNSFVKNEKVFVSLY